MFCVSHVSLTPAPRRFSLFKFCRSSQVVNKLPPLDCLKLFPHRSAQLVVRDMPWRLCLQAPCLSANRCTGMRIVDTWDSRGEQELDLGVELLQWDFQGPTGYYQEPVIMGQGELKLWCVRVGVVCWSEALRSKCRLSLNIGVYFWVNHWASYSWMRRELILTPIIYESPGKSLGQRAEAMTYSESETSSGNLRLGPLWRQTWYWPLMSFVFSYEQKAEKVVKCNCSGMVRTKSLFCFPQTWVPKLGLIKSRVLRD